MGILKSKPIAFSRMLQTVKISTPEKNIRVLVFTLLPLLEFIGLASF
jgi:hypothetical protein